MKKIFLPILLIFSMTLLIAGCTSSTSNQEVNVSNNDLIFNAKTINGATVTEAIFTDYDLTMINIWGTYCDPCIAEMPELQELYSQLPENVNMLTICVDGEQNFDLAQAIYDYAEGTFLVLFPDQGLIDNLLSNVSAIPTTLFVDKDGNIVGSPQIGAPGPSGEGKLVDAYMSLINDNLL